MKLLRILIFAVLGIGLLVGVALGGASWWVMRRLGPEVWIEQAESAWNCRAQIDDAQLSLFTRPASLTFKNLSLAPRDAEVAKPYAERIRLADGAAPIHIPEAVMEVTLEDLLDRRLNIHHLRFVRPVVREGRDEQGHSSLEEMFRRPGSNEEAPVPPPLTPVTQAPPPNAAVPPAAPDTVPRAIPVDSAPPASVAEALAVKPEEDKPRFIVRIEAAEIIDGQFHVTSDDTTIDIRDLDFSVTDLDITQNSRSHATLNLEVSVVGNAKIQGVKQRAEMAHVRLSGTGDIQPIDAKTGEWNPLTLLKLKLAKDSLLGGHVTMGDAAGKDMRKLQEYGVDLTPLPLGGRLLEDTIVDGAFKDGQFSLLAATRFGFPDYEVVIEPGSWIHASKDVHDVRFRLTCSPALQQRLETGVAQAKLGESIARGVTQALADERGRMTFDMESTGPLSDPEIKPSLDRLLRNLLQGRGLGDLLKGLFKKL